MEKKRGGRFAGRPRKPTPESPDGDVAQMLKAIVFDYNGTLVGSADWYDLPAEPTHVKGFGALDLWADSGGQGVLYDDISLVAVPEPSTAGVLLCLQVLALLSRRRWA